MGGRTALRVSAGDQHRRPRLRSWRWPTASSSSRAARSRRSRRAGRASARCARSSSPPSTALYDVDLLRQDLTVYRHRAHAQGVGAGQAAGYRAETVIDIPFVRHTGEPLALQFAHFLDLVSGRADACAERNSILPAHEIAAAIEACVMSEPSVSYVIPVHNQIAELRRTVRLLVERLGHLPGSEIILVENGSTDGSGATLPLARRDVRRRGCGGPGHDLGQGPRACVAPRAWRSPAARRSCSPRQTCPLASPISTATSALSPRPPLVIGSEDASRLADRDAGGPARDVGGVRPAPPPASSAPNVDTQGIGAHQRSLAHGAAPAPAHRRLPDRRRDQLLGGPCRASPRSRSRSCTRRRGAPRFPRFAIRRHMAVGLLALRRRLLESSAPPPRAGEVTAS